VNTEDYVAERQEFLDGLADDLREEILRDHREFMNTRIEGDQHSEHQETV
jgi:uncharacterized membrane protein